MLRSLFVPASVFLFGLSSSVFASSAPAPECYPLVHGENGQGSTNSLYLPHLYLDSTWESYISVTNTSSEFVNVKLNFKDSAGVLALPRGVDYYGAFNASNTPLSVNSGGAILKPNESARVRVANVPVAEAVFGSISWQADSCIDSALLVTVRSQYSENRLASSLMLLNNGQPF